jgi:hypothetical protein
MTNGLLDLVLFVDNSAEKAEQLKQDFESEDYTVLVKKQDSGKFAVAAAKFSPD